MIPRELSLRAGDVVQVRSEQEILATLDAQGRIDELPFMPEMLQYCGRQFRVRARADKTCDTVKDHGTARRMLDTVHLEGVRCDGSAHGGCQAGCLLFWKEAWLKPARTDGATAAEDPAGPGPITRAGLLAQSQRPDPDTREGHAYVCQATELRRASQALPWWEPRQYVRDLRWGNISFVVFMRTLALACYNTVMRKLGWKTYPYVAGEAHRSPPSGMLDLKPGERVRVRSREEIMATLTAAQRHRGLWFDVEMVPFCGREFQVQRRVERIIDEHTGRMWQLPGDCIVLDGVACSGLLSRKRLFCPRAITPYWREIWLERVATAPSPTSDRR